MRIQVCYAFFWWRTPRFCGLNPCLSVAAIPQETLGTEQRKVLDQVCDVSRMVYQEGKMMWERVNILESSDQQMLEMYMHVYASTFVSKHFLGRTFSFDMLNSLVCWISHNIGGNKSVWDAAIRILGVNSGHFANLCTLQLLAYEIQFANPADPWNIFGMYNQLCFTNQLKNWLHHVDPWIR